MKKDWDNVFNDEGELVEQLSFSVVSTSQDVIDTLYLHGFILVKDTSKKSIKGNDHHFLIFPDNKYIGTAAIPSQYKG
jgi:hypothetical protein